MPVRYVVNAALSATPLSRSKHMDRRPGLPSKSRTLFESQDLLTGMAAFGLSTTLSDWVQTQPQRLQSRRLSHQSRRLSHQSRRLTSHADTVTSRILQNLPTSKNCPSPSIPYSLLNFSLLLLTRSTLPIKFAQYLFFRSALSIHRAQLEGSRRTQVPCHIGSPVSRTSESREPEKRSLSPPPPHQPQKRKARKDEESIAQTEPTHT